MNRELAVSKIIHAMNDNGIMADVTAKNTITCYFGNGYFLHLTYGMVKQDKPIVHEETGPNF